MRLTPRCLNLLNLLRVARWLTTGQVHSRYFGHASLDATRKRLRKLTANGYLTMVQPQRMSEAIFTLGREGKRILERSGDQAIGIERRLPIQFEHLAGINSIRIAAELSTCISFFFACWELPRLGWRDSIIPDGIFSMKDRSFAVEYDRGVEGLHFFVRTKMGVYQRGLERLPSASLLIVADSPIRMAALANAVGQSSIPVFYTTLDLIKERGMLEPIFWCSSGAEPCRIV